MPFQILPKWVQFGAFMLAMNAGMINVLGLICLLHQSVSHMTGNASLMAISLVDDDYASFFFLIFVIISYVLGSSLSGLILGNSQFKLGRRYGFPLSLVTLFILICCFLIDDFPRYALLWACASMGVQNAMVSHYQGAIIRTTHLSGVLTDLGLALGYFIRGLKPEKKKTILHLLILFGFISGSIVAAFAYPYLQLQSFLLPAGLSLSLSLSYWIIYFRYSYLVK
ncbi:DUF1275 domain-containing protein [Acinetobacter sp. 194]|uniref:YoaK family protein n=1 Tax=Acinetobacter shaoyimingii TaxID=2715164 RepID=UPI001407A1E3|nr:YoaK family protein [Acinetobacter shaoyimingii]NHB57505.1 DUF1275 domain-containing protein [Acinetobacter shaoyimingii]